MKGRLHRGGNASGYRTGILDTAMGPDAGRVLVERTVELQDSMW